MSDYKLLIDGKLVAGDAMMDVINPATEEVLATCPRGSERQLNEAVAAAKAAFKTWRKVPMEDRRALLMKLADAVEARDLQARMLASVKTDDGPERFVVAIERGIQRERSRLARGVGIDHVTVQPEAPPAGVLVPVERLRGRGLPPGGA